MDAIPLITEDVEEAIVRSTVRGTETFKNTRINRGEGGDYDRPVSFCAAIKGDSS